MPKISASEKQRRKADWLEAGIPPEIVDWVSGDARDIIAHHPAFAALYRRRLDRYRKYWTQNADRADLFVKHWATIRKASKSPEDLIKLFIRLPDEPGQYGIDFVGHSELERHKHRSRYLQAEKSLRSAINLLDLPALKQLFDDCARSGAYPLLPLVILDIKKLKQAQARISSLIELARPAAAEILRHQKNADASIRSQIKIIASLNAFLARPKHVALTEIANITSGASVSADSVRKAWLEIRKKTAEFHDEPSADLLEP